MLKSSRNFRFYSLFLKAILNFGCQVLSKSFADNNFAKLLFIANEAKSFA